MNSYDALKIEVRATKNMQAVISITIPAEQRIQAFNMLRELKNKQYVIDVKEKKLKRSLDSNAYAWILMDKIAQVIGSTKEDVYREVIKNVGVFEITPIKDIAVNSWCEAWSNKGLGWVAEPLGASKIKGYTNVINYFGSSFYDTKQMSRLIDSLVEEAKEIGIETLPPDEINSLMESWNKNGR